LPQIVRARILPAMSADPAVRIERNSPEIEAAFDAAPSICVAEIIHGALHVMPRPARPHTNAASNLGALLVPPLRFGTGGPGGWVILHEPELHLGPRPDKLVPDLAGWRRARMPDAVGVESTPAHYDIVPDWICEILSAGTEVVDRGDKMPIYAREGVSHAWLVDPVSKTLEMFRLEGNRWRPPVTHHGDGRVRVEPFEAIEIDLALLWSR